MPPMEEDCHQETHSLELTWLRGWHDPEFGRQVVKSTNQTGGELHVTM